MSEESDDSASPAAVGGLPFDLWSLARYILIAVGSALATHGSAHAGHITQADVQTIAGAVIALASSGWGIYVRWNSSAVPKSVANRPDVPTLSSATGRIVN